MQSVDDNVADTNDDMVNQKQLNWLIYLTTKNMIEYFGPVLIKGIKLPVNIWSTIGQKLNEMPGQKRTPKSWSRTFSTIKFAVIAKFVKFVSEQKNKYGENCQPDWTKINKLNMLLIHEYCTQNHFPQLPSIPEILKSIEKYDLIEVEALSDDFIGILQATPKKNLERKTENTKTQICLEKRMLEDENLKLDTSSKGSACSADNINNKNRSNKQTRVHRTSKNTVQSYYITYLAYLTLNHILNTHGELYRKNCRLDVHAWNDIAKQMYEETGFLRPAEQWRKTLSSNKYVVQTRFLERLKQNGETRSTVNWSNVRVEELLFLQPLRYEGYTNMPSPREVLQAYEMQFMLNRNNDSNNDFITPNIVEDYEKQEFFNNASENYDLDPVEIKTECISDNDLSLEETFEITEIIDNDVNKKRENASFSNSKRKRNFNSITTVKEDWSETLENEEQNFEQKLNSDKVESQKPSHEQYYLERRLLEINEKILKEKIKKNKILHKRNKLLKKQTNIFDKMCAKLDILIDKKSI